MSPIHDTAATEFFDALIDRVPVTLNIKDRKACYTYHPTWATKQMDGSWLIDRYTATDSCVLEFGTATIGGRDVRLNVPSPAWMNAGDSVNISFILDGQI